MKLKLTKEGNELVSYHYECARCEEGIIYRETDRYRAAHGHEVVETEPGELCDCEPRRLVWTVGGVAECEGVTYLGNLIGDTVHDVEIFPHKKQESVYGC